MNPKRRKNNGKGGKFYGILVGSSRGHACWSTRATKTSKKGITLGGDVAIRKKEVVQRGLQSPQKRFREELQGGAPHR